MPPGWSDEELIHELMFARWRGFVPMPDTEVIERPGWRQIITPSFREGGFNDVVFSALDEADADAIIDEILDRYRRAGVLFRWNVGPGSRPADLAERLARRGLHASESVGMVRSTAGIWEDAEGVTVDEVDETTVDALTRTMAAGWSMDPAPLDAYHRLLLAHPARSQRLFLARYRGEPAGAAGLSALQRSVYLVGAVALPAFRGRGVYRSLVAARLRYAAERGIPLATTQARPETSAPILERLGFETVCRFPVFSNRA